MFFFGTCKRYCAQISTYHFSLKLRDWLEHWYVFVQIHIIATY